MLSPLRATICEQVAGECAARFGNQLRAILLTGSLARDEATIREEQGRRRLLGDAEFLLVFHESSRLPAASDVGDFRRGLEGAQARRGVEGRLSLGTVHPCYLRKLKPHIFAYELKTCGRVIWGDPGVLLLIPGFSPADIPQEDAWRLLCNRMIEQLEVVQDRNDPVEAIRRGVPYATIKLYLDMATSYLVFAGAYEPTYRDRARRLRDVAAAISSDVGAPFPLVGFADRVARCTEVKLAGAAPETLLSDHEGPLEFWAGSLIDARRLWRWELRRLTGLGDDTSDRALWGRWMQRQPARAKLRGWVSALRHLDGGGGWRCWPRLARRVWSASPRYWVYAAASELCFRLPPLVQGHGASGADRHLEELFAFLPETRQAAWTAGRAGWQSLVSEILRNYHRFLTETRA